VVSAAASGVDAAAASGVDAAAAGEYGVAGVVFISAETVSILVDIP
jgi:hypothetical protein